MRNGDRRRGIAIAALAACLAMPTAVPAQAQPGPAQTNIEQRLRALEDRAAIEQLITADYASAIDLTDTKGLSELFTEDGEFGSEWRDMASLPGMLGDVFRRGGATVDGKLRPRIAFRGRGAIANYMLLVVTGIPEISIDGDTAIAMFRGGAPADGPAPGGSPPGGPPAGAATNPMMDRYASMKHIVTNPAIAIDGDSATATSYWIEVAMGKDGSNTIIGGGYYSDLLARVDGKWLFRSRLIHNFDMGSN